MPKCLAKEPEHPTPPIQFTSRVWWINMGADGGVLHPMSVRLKFVFLDHYRRYSLYMIAILKALLQSCVLQFTDFLTNSDLRSLSLGFTPRTQLNART